VLLFNGVLSGASLDKVIVQLPARTRMGTIGYAGYARAADLGNGVVFYAAVGVGAAALTIAAAIAALTGDAAMSTRTLLGTAALLSVSHSAATAVAAPAMFRIGRSPDTDEALAPLLSRFARASTVRAVLQVATFVLVAVVAVSG
jgi:hypothetical protein